MKKHYGFDEAEYKILLQNGITIENLFDYKELFSVSKFTEFIPITGICLYYFIDRTINNPFSSKDPPSIIFLALFDKLDFISKMEIREYNKYIGLENNV